jgi:hypothetical protein
MCFSFVHAPNMLKVPKNFNKYKKYCNPDLLIKCLDGKAKTKPFLGTVPLKRIAAKKTTHIIRLYVPESILLPSPLAHALKERKLSKIKIILHTTLGLYYSKKP